MHTSETEQKSVWQKSHFSNLVRYVPSGIYFARIRVNGKLFRKSLKTDVLSVAKLRLRDLEKELRHAAESQIAATNGKMTFANAETIFRQRLDGDGSLKQSTKVYHQQRIAALRRSWPELDKLDIRDISKADCLNWAARFGKDASSSAFNNTVAVLRNIVEIGVEAGARYDNPARFVKRVSIRAKKLRLPEPDQFDPFLLAIERGGGRYSQDCADLVRFLAYGGFRKSEAASITWKDCDFRRGKIGVWGTDDSGTKNGLFREVPMIPEMKQLLEGLKAERPDEPMETAVMAVSECQKAIDRAAKEIGINRITHHDLRHLFATRCIESGVDIPTVSRWLGHKDGGALAMKTYGHLRDQHSADMAQRVTFSKPAPENVVAISTSEAA